MITIKVYTNLLFSYLQATPSSPGYPSTMASRNKNIPFSKGSQSNGIPARPAWKGVSSSEQAFVQGTQALHRKQYMSLHNSPPRYDIDHRTYSNDPTVREWVVSSASGSQYPAEDSFQYSYHGSNNATSYGPNLPEYANNFQSAVSEISLSSHVRMYDIPDPRISMDLTCTAATSDAMTMPVMGTNFPSDPGYIENAYSMENDANTWTTESHAVPDSSEMVYSTSAGLHQKFPMDLSEDLQSDSYWREAQISRLSISCDGVIPCTSSQMPFSPLSAIAMDPSVSSYSQNSFYPLNTGSPGSSGTQEDLPSLENNGIKDEEYVLTLVDGQATFTSSYNCDAQSDHTRWARSGSKRACSNKDLVL